MSAKKHDEKPCPHCGYCPHCGHAPVKTAPWPVYPYPVYIQPKLPWQQPYTITCGGDTNVAARPQSGNVSISSVN